MFAQQDGIGNSNTGLGAMAREDTEDTRRVDVEAPTASSTVVCVACVRPAFTNVHSDWCDALQAAFLRDITVEDIDAFVHAIVEFQGAVVIPLRSVSLGRALLGHDPEPVGSDGVVGELPDR